uniref:Uncharacterized protein n=1 Tax=Glossina austeni TaxID=7395 RepID=A0A1A9V6M2_GLOAU
MKQTDVCKRNGMVDEADNNIPLTVIERLRRSLKYIGYTSLDNPNAIVFPQNIQDECYCINNLDYSDEGEKIVDSSEQYGVPLNVEPWDNMSPEKFLQTETSTATNYWIFSKSVILIKYGTRDRTILQWREQGDGLLIGYELFRFAGPETKHNEKKTQQEISVKK